MTESAAPREPGRTALRILGVPVHPVNFAETLDLFQRWIDEADLEAAPCRQVCTVNPEFIVDAWRDRHFAHVLARAALCVPDGVGVLWAANLLGTPLRQRVTGSDGIDRICQRAAIERWRVFLLGAAPGVAAQAAAQLRARHPGLIVCGCYSGDPTDEEWPAIQGYLRATRPHVLFVAFGHPRQELWIDRHRADLPVQIAIGVGGAFDFIAGTAQRAPRWLQRLGLEWLHRLWREPWRWRRMRKLPLFVVLVLRQWLHSSWS